VRERPHLNAAAVEVLGHVEEGLLEVLAKETADVSADVKHRIANLTQGIRFLRTLDEPALGVGRHVLDVHIEAGELADIPGALTRVAQMIERHGADIAISGHGPRASWQVEHRDSRGVSTRRMEIVGA